MAGTDVGVEMTKSKGDGVVVLVGPRWCGDVLAPGTRKEGRKEVREVNVIEDPWRQPARKRRTGNTRENRKNEERGRECVRDGLCLPLRDCGARCWCIQDQGSTALGRGVSSHHLDPLSTASASSRSRHPGDEPFLPCSASSG